VQHEPKDIVGSYCCLRMTSDDISAPITYVMWREEHLWNVSVLHIVHLTNLVSYCTVWYT
jgi:hypothetical protein